MSDSIHFRLRDLFQSDTLSTRKAARTLLEKIQRSPQMAVVLDFEEIEFASRSFLDELNAFRNTSKKSLDFINLGKNIKTLFAIVQKTADNKSRFTYEPVHDAEVIAI